MVFVHPFGEEMNKSRRMAVSQARRLAAAGHAVIQIDLLGCGDSSGEFIEARWQAWREDVCTAMEWIRPRGGGIVRLWGLRLGATLAVDVAQRSGADVEGLVLWQPVVNGEQFLTQFLRLQLAADMLTGSSAQRGVRDLRATLAAGKPLEIAGYDVHPELATIVDQIKLLELAPAVKLVHWLEVSAQAEPAISPGSQNVLNAWAERGLEVRSIAVSGEPFWSTLEITECEALLAATSTILKLT